jgi:hypothetical protein
MVPNDFTIADQADQEWALLSPRMKGALDERG